ncbi:MAG: hypothetical protein U5L45_00865 [Saprospiraceae bacterium]|nr:hypothetical protein [Saprospiraceae bacterium]
MKKMTNFARFAVIAALTFTAFALQSFTTQCVVSPTPPDFIIIPASTEVSLESQQNYTSEDVEVGAQVDFIVRSNVTVNRVVVIAAGATASGEVKRVIKANKSCTNCASGCAMLQIQVNSVEAVDGSTVRLRSIPINITAPNPTCAAVLSIGKTVGGTVLNATKIHL